MRYAILAVLIATAAACNNESIHAPDDWREEAGPEGTDVNIDPARTTRFKAATAGLRGQ